MKLKCKLCGNNSDEFEDEGDLGMHLMYAHELAIIIEE
jgi:hypothetical protein